MATSFRWNVGAWWGPMTAMTGVLLFGWSTAVIFEVLRKVLELTEIRKDARP
jgi:hypothetical protein